MALLGKAAVAMWWNMAAAQRDEFEDWHSHEHFPERMGIPGFLRGSRWASADGGEGFFVMYELRDYETLTSDGYRARLDAPTPWSTKMMPHHRDMVRSQCRVLDSAGGGIGAFALTLRLSPREGGDADLRRHLGDVAATFTQAPGGVACHLLRTETPAQAATREQQIRGGRDKAADWILVAIGYSSEALEALRRRQLAGGVLEAHGARPDPIDGIYRLAHAAAATDFR